LDLEEDFGGNGFMGKGSGNKLKKMIKRCYYFILVCIQKCSLVYVEQDEELGEGAWRCR
jgi:hypothetical protein